MSVKIDAGKLEPVYVLVSAEPLLLDRTLRALREATVAPALRAFNEDVIEGRGATATRVLGAARTLPMMGPKRLVLVREIGAMTAAELGGLIEYLEAPSPSTVLVATAAKADKRLKFFSVAAKKGVMHELTAPRDLNGWVNDEARQRKIAIKPDAVRRLTEAVGADLSRLSLVLDQLAVYAGEGVAIAVDDVDDLVADTRERSVFELTDAIGAGDRMRAMAAVAALCDQRQSAVGVVAMLGRHMRQLSVYRAARAGGVAKSEMARVLGVPPFVVDKIGRQAERYGDAALDKAVIEISATDRTLKGEDEVGKTLGRGLTERVLLDRIVERLVDLGR